jgi:hypothetical protein
MLQFISNNEDRYLGRGTILDERSIQGAEDMNELRGTI